MTYKEILESFILGERYDLKQLKANLEHERAEAQRYGKDGKNTVFYVMHETLRLRLEQEIREMEYRLDNVERLIRKKEEKKNGDLSAEASGGA